MGKALGSKTKEKKISKQFKKGMTDTQENGNDY
jgi:hypothetical protein